MGKPQIPAIVRRQENAAGNTLCIGYSSPFFIDGVRLRIGSKVPFDSVIDHKTPFDAVNCNEKNLPCFKTLEALLEAGGKYNVQVGCFGAAALQIITGLEYLRKESDLDIYLRHSGGREELEGFFAKLISFEKQFGVIIDAEIEYQGQYGVKLKELFGPGKTVLGKGLYDVLLLDKAVFFENHTITKQGLS